MTREKSDDLRAAACVRAVVASADGPVAVPSMSQRPSLCQLSPMSTLKSDAEISATLMPAGERDSQQLLSPEWQYFAMKEAYRVDAGVALLMCNRFAHFHLSLQILLQYVACFLGIEIASESPGLHDCIPCNGGHSQFAANSVKKQALDFLRFGYCCLSGT